MDYEYKKDCKMMSARAKAVDCVIGKLLGVLAVAMTVAKYAWLVL